MESTSINPSVAVQQPDADIRALQEENQQLRLRLQHSERERKSEHTRYLRLTKKLEGMSLASSQRFGSDQLDALARGGTLQGTAWSNQTVMKALSIHFATGTTGYKVVSECQMPLPSIRVLQERIQHIKFEPGIQKEIFQMLPKKTMHMVFPETECMMAFDEASIKEALEFDPSTNSFIGNCTIPTAPPKMTREQKEALGNDPKRIKAEQERVSKASLSTKACKGMVFVIGGVAYRWKQIVAYHFTGNSFDSNVVAGIVVDLLKKGFNIGLMIRVLMTDMGNRGVWRALGIDVGPNSSRASVPHPADPSMRLWVSPDPVHVWKNIVEMLRSNKFILIDDHYVKQFSLPSPQVELEHLRTLCKFQEKMRWKLAPSLSEDLLAVNHFGKMKVSNATKVFNLRVAASLEYLSTLPEGTEGMRTTAWFIKISYQWFRTMTARQAVQGLSLKNPAAFQKEIDKLHLAYGVYTTFKAGGEWKPCQTGVKAATLVALDLIDLYLNKLKLLFFLLGRNTTDIVENIFSLLRIIWPNLTPLQFKQRLRMLTVSHFMRHLPKSSYETDDCEDLLDLLDKEQFKAEAEARLEEALEQDIQDEEEEIILATLVAQNSMGLKTLTRDEMVVFYRVCGYILFKLHQEKQYLQECQECWKACQHLGPVPHPYSLLLRHTEFKDGALIHVSEAVFRLLLKTEECVMAVEHSVKKEVLQ